MESVGGMVWVAMSGSVERYRGETVVRWQRVWVMLCLGHARRDGSGLLGLGSLAPPLQGKGS